MNPPQAIRVSNNPSPGVADDLLITTPIMQVKFTLFLRNVQVNDRHVDEVLLEWVAEASPEEVLEMSQEWITTQNFLTQRMSGVKRVGESSFTIEPLDGKH